jgi:mRNA-degrading endonuclease toxin of MazEF toxin-antitoxin module
MAKNLFWKVVGLGIGALLGSDGAKRGRRGTGSRKTPRGAAPRSERADARFGSTATIEVDPNTARDLRLEYAPKTDGHPDAGEIVWTWVPYVENDGRGKDRPVLVIARHTADRVYAVKLTSKDKPGRDDRLAIGSGSWDSSGRASWVDIDQLYSVHHDGLRREAAALDIERFTRVASALQARFGWKTIKG